MKSMLLTGATLLALTSGAFAQTTTRPEAAPVDRAPASSLPSHAAPATSAAVTGTPSTMSGSAMFTSVPGQQELTSNVVGLNVYNSANKDVGTIKDVAFDKSGVKAYILSVGGVLGMGTRYIAVQPSAINISYDSNAKKWHAAMNADVDQLKAAPEFKYSSAS